MLVGIRDPVELTAAGRRLFAFVKPFFEGLPLVAREIAFSGKFCPGRSVKIAGQGCNAYPNCLGSG